jgi:hypothetical protein
VLRDFSFGSDRYLSSAPGSSAVLFIHTHDSVPTRMALNPPAENAVAAAGAGMMEPKLQEVGQETENTDRPVKFSKVLMISFVLCLATLCVSIDNTIISTAVPRITKQFHSIDDVDWYAAYVIHP